MNKLAAVVLIVVVGSTLGVRPAAAQEAAETAVVVTTEAEYRAALTTLSADNAGPHTITLGADIVIDDGTDPTYTGQQALTIVGNGHVLDGAGTNQILHHTGAGGPVLTLQDVVVQNGHTSDFGGGVQWNGPAVIEGGGFFDNEASGAGSQFGGAAFIGGALSITDATFQGNLASSTTANAIGGVIYANGGATVTVMRSAFRGNRAEAPAASARAGGVFTTGTVSLTASVAVQNAAVGPSATGGAVRAAGGIQVDGSWLWDNFADATDGDAAGGALYASGGPVDVVNSTLEENQVYATTTASGSAIYGGAVSLEDTTVGENLATGGTVARAAVFATTLTAHQSTIAGNAGDTVANVQATTLTGTTTAIGQPVDGPNCQVTTSTLTYSIDDDGTCGLGTGEGNVSNGDDLGLGPVRDNGGSGIPAPVDGEPEAATDPFPIRTMFPLAGSPVVDLVPPAECWDDLDQRFVERPVGEGCEAGATESVYPEHGFSDVPVWVEDAVRWLASDVNDPRLITGITATTFVPNDPITRGQVVRMLYREADSPDGYPAHPFTDVPGWVEDAVRWAYDEGIVTGITPTLFEPNDPISRAQVVRMKYRFAGSPPVGALPAHPFTDAPGWVQEAVRWAANTNNPLPLATGITATTFRPDDPITRAQVARMDYRLAITPGAWADPGDAPSTVPFRGPPMQ